MHESWVVGRKDRPCFLRRDQRGNWVVVQDPERALTFPSVDQAQAACDHYEARYLSHIRSAPGRWRVYRMTLKASFR